MSDRKDGVYVVTHSKLNMLVHGKTKRMEIGTELTLKAAQAERLGNKVVPKKEAKKVDLTKSDKQNDK